MIQTAILTDCARSMLTTVERPLNQVKPWVWLLENTRLAWTAHNPGRPVEMTSCRMN